MSNVERLQNWVDEEKKNGLISIHFFPSDYAIMNLFACHNYNKYPCPDNSDVEKAAGDILYLLTSKDREDITGVEL